MAQISKQVVEEKIGINDVLYASPLKLRIRFGGNVELPEDRILVNRINAAFDFRFTRTQNVYRDSLEGIYEQTQERKYQMNLI